MEHNLPLRIAPDTRSDFSRCVSDQAGHARIGGMSVVVSPWGPTLSSPRVRLEPIVPRQARAMLRGTPEPDLAWEQGFPLSTLLGALGKVVAADEAGVALGPFFAYAIVRQSDGLAVGDAGFHGPPGPDGEVEIGYALVPVARGRGLASEAARLLIGWARTQPGVASITARVDPGNQA